MWTLLERRRAEKQLSKVPKVVLRRYQKWKDIAETQGPMGLLGITGFRDHALSGEWAGARSSYLNDQWRVIYVVHGSLVSILVLEVTPHDYRRKL
jgi:addiction module RelE/StbE family toxin